MSLNLKFSKKVKTVTPFTGKGSLYEKISKARDFVVYGSKDYYQNLVNRDPLMLLCKEIAEELNKPVILIIDKTLSKQEVIAIERYFTGMNIIKEYVVDFSDPVAMKKATDEMERMGIAEEKKELDELLAVNFRWS